MITIASTAIFEHDKLDIQNDGILSLSLHVIHIFQPSLVDLCICRHGI